MSQLVTINTIENGTVPITVHVCDLQQYTCGYIGTIQNYEDLPYSFNLPLIFENSNYLVRLTDHNECVFIKYVN